MAIRPWSAPFFPSQKRRIANILQAIHVGISTVVILHHLQRNITWTAAAAIYAPPYDSHENGHAHQQVHAVQSLHAQLFSMVQNRFLPKRLCTNKRQPRNNVVMQKVQGQTIAAPFINNCVVNHHHPHITPFLAYHDTKGNLIGTNYHSSQLQ